MEFSRQGYWSGLPAPSSGNLSDPGTEPGSPTLQADSLLSEPRGKPLILPTHLHKTLFLRHRPPYALSYCLTYSWSPYLASPTKSLTSRDFQVSTLNNSFISPPCSPGIPIHCEVSHSVVSDSLQCHGLSSPWNFPSQIPEWVAFPLGSSQPRDRTQVSRIAGGFFTS